MKIMKYVLLIVGCCVVNEVWSMGPTGGKWRDPRVPVDRGYWNELATRYAVSQRRHVKPIAPPLETEKKTETKKPS